MGQKVNPIGLRVGVIKDWRARWYAGQNYADLLHEDLELRDFIKNKLFHAGVSSIDIERAANRVRVTIYAAKPGIVIGRGGSGVDALRRELEAMTGKQIHLNIEEVRVPEMDAQLVAENIAQQLERRVAFRRAMKQAMNRTMRMGAEGVRIHCAGRLGGAEMARRESYHEGTVPLQTLRADIDYGFTEAKTTYGRIGVKVWINKGEILPETPRQGGEAQPAATEGARKGGD